MKARGITQRGENTYRFSVSCGSDGNGKQIRKTTTFKVPAGTSARKAEMLAREAYLEFYSKCKNNPDFNENMRFSELVEIYLKQYAANELKAVTVFNYKSNLKNHILPVFANKKVKDINTIVLTEFLLGLELAPDSTRKIKTVLSSVFSFGVSQGYIKVNPCHRAICKKVKTKNKKVKYLNKEECKKLLQQTSEYNIVNTIIQFLLFTGLRVGEALALQWKNLDFENDLIIIEDTLAYVEGEKFLDDAKTEKSVRVIKMGNNIRELLLKHKEEQDKSKEIVGKYWEQPNIVFTNEIGKFYDSSKVNRELKKILAKNNLKKITTHGLRHTNASLMINNGIGIKAVSEQLGHCNIAVTGDTYSHIFDEYKARIANAIEKDLV